MLALIAKNHPFNFTTSILATNKEFGFEENDAKKIDFDDSMIYSEFSKKIEDRKIPIKQMLRDEALKAFEIWDKKKDKIEY